MPKKGNRMTEAQRQEARERSKAWWTAKRAMEAENEAGAQAESPSTSSDTAVAVLEVEAEPDPKEQVQCLFCGTYFERQNLALHQTYMHKGELPTEEPALPSKARSLPAGAIVRSEAAPGQRGIPMKVPWSKRLLERGWECNDPGCRDPQQPGWRVIPEDENEVPACQRCGGAMHKLSHMIDWDAPPNAPHIVVWQNLQYWIQPDAVNRLPDIIVGQARATLDEDRRNRMPLINMQPGGEYQAGRLRSTGLMGAADQEEPAQAEA